MQSGGAGKGPAEAGETPEAEARRLMRTAWKATLATLDRDSGHPHGSLVAVATEPDGAPILLLSGLALHTRNLAKDARASLLLDGTAAGREALTGPRVTVVGRIERTDSPVARRRYIAKHPSAEMFAGFGDFAFYRLDVDHAHLVAGFGRIERIEGPDLVSPVAGAEAVVEAEAGIVQHMNEDHADAVELIAAKLGRAPSAAWRMIGCDPCGIDLAAGDAALRIDFAQRITTPAEARSVLVQLVAQARNLGH